MGNMKRKDYEAALEPLQVELNEMARWLGLERVAVNCRRPSGERLQGLLTQA